jgi:DNA-binding GntR family transcriptional regulator
VDIMPADFKPADSLTEQIARHLGDQIISGELRSGQRIQELKVARNLGVSRGSVREALLILESRHLIDNIPRRGALVTDLSYDRSRELVDLCNRLQIMLLETVAERWREGDLAALDEVLEDAVELADASPDAVLALRARLLHAVMAIGGNAYLNASLAALLPSLDRVAFKVLGTPRGREAFGDHLRALRRLLGDRNAEALRACVEGFGGWQLQRLRSAECH